jgi:hypothetical protein
MARKIVSFVSFNDAHFTLIPPISRTSAYPKDIARKLIETINIGKKLNVNYIASTGDILHRKGAASSREGYIIEGIFKKSNIPIIGVLGNHDISGYNFESRKNRPIGMIEQAGLYNVLDNKPIIIGDVMLTGSSYQHNYEESRDAYFKRDDQLKYFTVAFTHGALVLSNEGKFWGTYTNLNMLRNEDRILHNVIINGHLHHHQNQVTLLGKRQNTNIFSNGSLARNILKEDVAKRTPTILHISILSDHTVVSEEIELKSAKHYSKAFIIPEVLDEKINGIDIKDFVESLLKESDEFDMHNDISLIKKIVKKKKFSKRVKHKIIEYVTEKEYCDGDHGK